MAPGDAWDESLPFRRDEFVRVISSCLRGLGHGKASRVLEEESGCRAELDDSTPLLLSCVSAGRWEQALSLLATVPVSRRCFFVLFCRFVVVQCFFVLLLFIAL